MHIITDGDNTSH